MGVVSGGPHSPGNGFRVVAVLASLGGLAAVSAVLAGLPADFPAAVLIIQHRRREIGVDRLAALLAQRTTLPVRTAEHGLPVHSAGVVVLPGGGRAARLDPFGRLLLSEDRILRPGDVLLNSLATAWGASALAVVLTGMLNDGTKGIRAVKDAGGWVLVQDPATARAPSMPASAVATGCVDFVLPVEHLATALVALTMAPGRADLLTVSSTPWTRLAG